MTNLYNEIESEKNKKKNKKQINNNDEITQSKEFISLDDIKKENSNNLNKNLTKENEKSNFQNPPETNKDTIKKPSFLPINRVR
jgi:hypothetical protein